MHRKWKGVAALGMAALIGCLMPVGTMMAAEDNPEVVQEVETGSEADVVDNDEAILGDNENAGEEEDAVTDENVDDEINADDEIADDEVSVDDENANDEVDADDVIADDEVDSDNDGNDGIAVMSEAEAGDVEVQASSETPVIDIKFNGQSFKYDLGGKIDYTYVNNHNQAFECSASQDGQAVSLYYCLKTVSDTNAEAMGEDKMNSLDWVDASSASIRIPLSSDAKYVLYVKAEGGEGADKQTAYARSGGIVVDTIAPTVNIILKDGGTYPEGKEFQVLDNNLESVEVNGVNVTSGWNAVYQVSANDTSSSCVIKLKDKAGNETIYNVNVSKVPAGDGVISASGIYTLTASTPYTFGAGQWQVNNDKSVYSGGNTFYVKASGDYSFTKR